MDFNFTEREWSIYHKFSDTFHRILESFNKRFPSTDNTKSALIMLMIHEGIDLIDDIEDLKERVSYLNEGLYNKEGIKVRLNSVYGRFNAEQEKAVYNSFHSGTTEGELINAAFLIKDNCNGKKKCEGCIFYRDDKPFSMQCALENRVPVNWDLRKEDNNEHDT